MAEGTYEYECERAELLGINPPNRADWEEAERVRRENQLAEQMTEAAVQDEKINEGTSKMEEITNILSITQMRLNKFKKACGSLTNLLKIKGGDGGDEGNQSDGEQQQEQATTDVQDGTEQSPGANAVAGGSAVNKQDMQQKMGSGLDKLDSLLAKTENAQISMAHQSKQMKSFLK